MKNYTYTARDLSGALTKGNLKAADRNAALAELRTRSLVPISVEEGIAPKEALRLSVAPRTLVLAGAAVVLVIGALLMMRGRTPEVRQPAATVAVVKPAPLPKATPPQTVEPVKPAASPAIPEPPQPSVEAAPAQPVALQGVVPPKAGKAALRPPPKADRVIVPGIRNADTNAPNPYATFKTKSERMMSMMLSAKPGEMILGVSLGRDFDKDFAASLSNTIEIYPTDTEEMADHKADVAWMKEEMRKMVKEGRSPEELLTTFRDQHNEVATFRSELQRQLSALKKEGKTKEAEDFAKEANKMLEPYGTKPLTAFPVIPAKKAKP